MFRIRDSRAAAMAATTLLLTGCVGTGTVSSAGASPGGSGNVGAPGAVSVTITPQSLVIKHGANWTFDAAATNASDPTVIWSIQEGPRGGAVSDIGVYTAPAANGIYHVIATSKADPTKSATTTVTVGDTGFTLSGSSAYARSGHTATLLPNGQVYIAGGVVTSLDYDFVTIDQAEVFNPATGTLQPGGKVARGYHTATLLQNGDVLFTGGINGEAYPQGGLIPAATAELLKAGSGSVQPTGSMGVGRYSHRATILQDGRVLITGGTVGPKLTVTQTAELYDPYSGSFTPVGDMIRPRANHSAILLLTGKVFIIGGGVADAEIFDPATNTFTAAGSTSSKSVSTATLLASGRVLVTGEQTSDGSAAAPAEIYDPTTGTFTPTGTMAVLRYGYAATLLPDDTVLMAGGYMIAASPTPGTGSVVPILATEIYNPATGSFNPGPTMHYGRSGHTATLLPDGGVLLVGASPTSEIYQ